MEFGTENLTGLDNLPKLCRFDISQISMICPSWVVEHSERMKNSVSLFGRN